MNRIVLVCVAIVLSACGSELAQVGSPGASGATSSAVRFNRSGNLLIADQFNNRVLEVDRGHVVWSFGDGSAVASATGVVAPNDVERVGDDTLISGTGAPAGAEPACDAGCADNRVLLVNREGDIVWQYGQAQVTGAGANQLNGPVCARLMANGQVLITDQGNQRIIAVTADGQIAWQYGTTGVAGAADNQLNNPNSAELLDNGNVLIADESNNRVIEVTPDGQVAWSYGSPSDTTTLNGAAYASRLPNGNTLISDSGNNRTVEVSAAGQVVWQFVSTSRTGSVAAPAPTRAVRLENGDTLISDQFNNQVIAVDPSGAVTFVYGQLGTAGTDPGQLNAPYDAKVVGDYTGLTSPFPGY